VGKIPNDSQSSTDAYTLRRSSYGAQAYEAFGNPISEAGSTVNPFRYVGALGCYTDRTSALRLLGARYYGPSPRRFWTRDPVKVEVNQYAYVGNNPVNAVDPSGTTILPIILPIIIGGAIVGGQLLCARGVQLECQEIFWGRARGVYNDRYMHCLCGCLLTAHCKILHVACLALANLWERLHPPFNWRDVQATAAGCSAGAEAAIQCRPDPESKCVEACSSRYPIARQGR
jgi:RHS repeat-associated protein